MIAEYYTITACYDDYGVVKHYCSVNEYYKLDYNVKVMHHTYDLRVRLLLNLNIIIKCL